MANPRRYLQGIFKQRAIAERHPLAPQPKRLGSDNLIRWLPKPFAELSPHPADFRKACSAAVKEAVLLGGGLFEAAESRLKNLEQAVVSLTDCVGHPSDDEYIARHEAFADALESVAPFIKNSPGQGTPQTSGSETRAKARSRLGRGGGRPETYPEKLCRDVVAARERDKKQAAKVRRRLPPIPRWLRDYCDEHSINITEQFPPHSEGEAWSVRANRFWKAATKRLREAETNRH